MVDKPRRAYPAAEREAALRAAVSRQPGSEHLLTQLAACLRKQGRSVEALEILEHAITPACQPVRLVTMRANILLELGRGNDAVTATATAVKVNPASIDLRLVLGRVHLANLQPAQAQRQLDAAMALDPDLPQIERLKKMQQRINSMKRSAEHRPLDWLVRKFNRRIADNARESGDKD